MPRLLLGFAALLALMPVDALAGEKKLTGPEIKAAFSDAKMTTKNRFGTIHTVFKADGTMTGKEKMGNWQEGGKWWVKGDRYCRKWSYFAGGKEACFGVTLDGNKVKWWRADGSDAFPNSSAIFTK